MAKKSAKKIEEETKKLAAETARLNEKNERIKQLTEDRSRLETELKRLREENEVLRSNNEKRHAHMIALETRLDLLHGSYEAALKVNDKVIKNILERGRIRAKHDVLYRLCREYILAGYTKYDKIAVEVALKAPQFTIHTIMQTIEEMDGKELTPEQQVAIIGEYEKRRPKTWTSAVREGKSGIYDILVSTSIKDIHALEDAEALKAVEASSNG